MSRIGNAPIKILNGVEVKVENKKVSVKGPKGELFQELDNCISINIQEDTITLSRETDSPEQRSKHGLYRSLINNMVLGVSEGFKKELEIVGVGYRAKSNGQILELSLGHSHPFIFELPQEKHQ